MYLRQALHRRRALTGRPRNGQRGVVLLVALIILVALTLSGVALIRSVDTANLIAGNQSFHQAAVHAAERSTETALANWLEANNALGDDDLFDTAPADANPPTGYLSARDDRIVTAGVPETWEAFWNRTTALTPPVTLAPDAAGNTVAYVIHRLCETPNRAPHLANCAKQPSSINTGGSFGAGNVAAITNNQVYYRITTRVQGPRNTVAYIQTIVAL
jgi:type IV pilus assembly protein PilX